MLEKHCFVENAEKNSNAVLEIKTHHFDKTKYSVL